MPERDHPIYIISIAAELAGVHPQTLRVYERKGLVQPKRTQGNSRRYSESDVAMLRRIQDLTQEGINLAGVMRILELEAEVERLKQAQQASEAQRGGPLVTLKDVRRVRRAMKSDLVEQDRRKRPFEAPAAPDPTGSGR